MGNIEQYYMLLILLYFSDTKKVDPDKEQFCKEVHQCKSNSIEVCGIRWDGEVYRLRRFPDECALLKYGCQVQDEKDAFGIINLEYCLNTSSQNVNSYDKGIKNLACFQDCDSQISNSTVCAMREEASGVKLRLFMNECEMSNYNCENNLAFNVTDHFLCGGLELPKESKRIVSKGYGLTENQESKEINDLTDISKDNFETNRVGVFQDPNNESTTTEIHNEDAENDTSQTEMYKESSTAGEYFGDNGVPLKADGRKRDMPKNLVVVDASIFANSDSFNDTVNNFFSATHVFDMPLKDVSPQFDLNTRRRLVRVFGPVMVFKPWITIPKEVKEDVMHKPTLSSCFHQCPQECPDTYAPVCGMPGIIAREPSLMFKNHCLMDAAQCKMRWDNASYTSESSSYIESSFVFCLGDTLNGLYRFLPLVRTLQHMGRIRRKGKYHIRLRNMRFFNEILTSNPRMQG